MEQASLLPSANEMPLPQRSKRREWFEILLAYGLILAVEWTPRPAQRVMWVIAALGIVLIAWRGFDGWKAMGFRRANLGRSLWIAGAALGLAIAAILIAARVHTLLLPSGPLALVGTYSAYAIWSGAQQFLLQGFFLLRFLRVIPKPALAAVTASLFFAGAHLPNPFLVPLTLIWGSAACLLFLRYRNIYALMIAHAILGITIAMTVPGPVDHNMRVGLGYLRYKQRARPHDRRPMRFHRPEFLRIELNVFRVRESVSSSSCRNS
jgi:membrane protease YdiL (CAAX protease family)